MGKRKRDLVEVDIQFPCMLSSLNLSKVVIDIIRNLLYQKNQIPVPYDLILKELECNETKSCGEKIVPLSTISSNRISTRSEARVDRIAKREAKNRDKFMKDSSRFTKEMDRVENFIHREIETGDVISINILFGATYLSPREIYSIELPSVTSEESISSRHIGKQLFKSIVANQPLNEMTSSKIPVSNMYLVFCKRSLPTLSELRLLNSYCLPSIERCPRANFIIGIPESPDGDHLSNGVAPIRRLRFPSNDNDDSNIVGDKHSGKPGLASITPRSNSDFSKHFSSNQVMDLCTPYISKSIKESKNDRELYTPSYTLNTCTPATGRVNKNEPMDLCTPAVNAHKLPTTLITPALPPGSENMDLCTPAPNKLEVVEHSKSTANLNLDLSNLSLKDSGISSPESADFQEEHFWFVTPSQIRGFK